MSSAAADTPVPGAAHRFAGFLSFPPPPPLISSLSKTEVSFPHAQRV